MKKIFFAVTMLSVVFSWKALALDCSDLTEVDELICFSGNCNDEDKAVYELMKKCGILDKIYPKVKNVRMRSDACSCHVAQKGKEMDLENVKASFFDDIELSFDCEKRASHLFCNVKNAPQEKGFERLKPTPEIVACPLDCMKWDN